MKKIKHLIFLFTFFSTTAHCQSHLKGKWMFKGYEIEDPEINPFERMKFERLMKVLEVDKSYVEFYKDSVITFNAAINESDPFLLWYWKSEDSFYRISEEGENQKDSIFTKIERLNTDELIISVDESPYLKFYERKVE